MQTSQTQLHLAQDNLVPGVGRKVLMKIVVMLSNAQVVLVVQLTQGAGSTEPTLALVSVITNVSKECFVWFNVIIIMRLALTAVQILATAKF